MIRCASITTFGYKYAVLKYTTPLYLMLRSLLCLVLAAAQLLDARHHHRRSHAPSSDFDRQVQRAHRRKYKAELAVPSAASPSTRYVFIKGKYGWADAAYTCWRHGYEIAALDKEAVRSVGRSLGKGDGKVREALAWFGRHGKPAKLAPYVFSLSSKGRTTIKSLSHHDISSSGKYSTLRIPVLCQVPKRGRRHHHSDPFRENDRCVYCHKKAKVCLLDRHRGARCKYLCRLGDDILYGTKPDFQVFMSSSGSDSSGSSSYSRSSRSSYSTSSRSL